MSRKEREFARIERRADDAGVDAGAPEPAGRPLRSEHRGLMSDLKVLANRLADLPRAVRRTLPLDEETQGQLDLLAAADATPDRRRHVMRAKLLLGACDLVQLAAALEGDGDAAAWDRESDRWRTRLIDGDDEVLQAFIERHPGADRQALRTSAREARGQGSSALRARARLLQLVRAAGRNE